MGWLKRINQKLQAFHDEVRRGIDLRLLWPAIREHALKQRPDDLHQGLELAREAFISYMSCDPIWRRFADPLSEEQLGDWVRSTLL